MYICSCTHCSAPPCFSYALNIVLHYKGKRMQSCTCFLHMLHGGRSAPFSNGLARSWSLSTTLSDMVLSKKEKKKLFKTLRWRAERMTKERSSGWHRSKARENATLWWLGTAVSMQGGNAERKTTGDLLLTMLLYSNNLLTATLQWNWLTGFIYCNKAVVRQLL